MRAAILGYGYWYVGAFTEMDFAGYGFCRACSGYVGLRCAT